MSNSETLGLTALAIKLVVLIVHFTHKHYMLIFSAGIQDIVSNSETLGLTALAFALVVLIVAIIARKLLAAAGYDVPSIISLFMRE